MPEGYEMKLRGSMTVFAALVFMLVASMLFALLEGARAVSLRLYADMTSELAVESVFAEYQPLLWEDYHLLCLDGAYGTGTFSEQYAERALLSRVSKNIKSKGVGDSLLKLSCSVAEVEEYQFLTDGEGAVFLHHAASDMKKNFPLLAAQQLYEQYVSGHAVIPKEREDDPVEAARQALADQKQEEKEDRPKTVAEKGEEENVLDLVSEHKRGFLLGMVLQEADELSDRRIENDESLEHRALLQGTCAEIPEVNWYEKILALEYADKYLSDYGAAAQDRALTQNRALAYEMEYVVGGKESDKENLEAVVGRLLLTREAANVVHIMMDGRKRLEVSEMAMILAGVTANAAVIKAVEYGLIGAWAYVESVLDVRALLHGDKISFMKGQNQWTSSLMNLSAVLDSSLWAENCEGGLSYQSYLKGFLFLMQEKQLAYRIMDVMEQTLRKTELYRNCRMDSMICASDYAISYEADTLFWKFAIIGQEDIGKLVYRNERSFSYE